MRALFVPLELPAELLERRSQVVPVKDLHIGDRRWSHIDDIENDHAGPWLP
jgi:hypothetical protein